MPGGHQGLPARGLGVLPPSLVSISGFCPTWQGSSSCAGPHIAIAGKFPNHSEPRSSHLHNGADDPHTFLTGQDSVS